MTDDVVVPLASIPRWCTTAALVSSTADALRTCRRTRFSTPRGPSPADRYRLRPVVDGAGSFLDALDARAQVRFAELGRIKRHRTGDVLFIEGDRSTNVLAIRHGNVKVTTTTADGHELVLAIRGPSELVGELAALDDREHRRSATVIALNAVTVQLVPNDEFVGFLEQHPRAPGTDPDRHRTSSRCRPPARRVRRLRHARSSGAHAHRAGAEPAPDGHRRRPARSPAHPARARRPRGRLA